MTPTGKIPDIRLHIRQVVSAHQKPRHRYRSWLHCYEAFGCSTDNNNDRLALQLAFYLASWGMYRGSAFLLEYDYTVHCAAVSLLRDPELSALRGAPVDGLIEQVELIHNAGLRLRRIYSDQMRELSDGGRDTRTASDTLITKVLLGTIGCVPAFDRYLKIGAKSAECSIGRFNRQSILQCFRFFERNREDFGQAAAEAKTLGHDFPPMKLLDMYFWAAGQSVSN